MIRKVEHIGIAVKNLAESEALYERILGIKAYKREEVVSELVMTVFFQAGDTKIELLCATSPESTIAKYIEKRGEGIHHIAYGVDDILSEMNRMMIEGFRLLNDKPKIGADNKLVCFLHPKDTNSVLIELCQDIIGSGNT